MDLGRIDRNYVEERTMQVNIGPYRNWFGPHRLAEKLCFWARKNVVDEYGMTDYPEYVFKLGEFLAYGKWRGINDIPVDKKNLFVGHDDKQTWLYSLLEKIQSKKQQKVKIRIDKWDTWSMDSTLALIILPMLIQLKATKHGSAFVDLEDVPPEMRMTSTEDWDDQYVFDFYNDSELSKQNVKCDVHTRWDWVMDEMIYAFTVLNDDIGYDSTHRVENGLRLFGKYYRGLWD